MLAGAAIYGGLLRPETADRHIHRTPNCPLYDILFFPGVGKR
jgi:hypothetical protein